MENRNSDYLDDEPSESRKESLWYRLFHKERVLEQETVLFIFASALDFFMTYLLLSRDDIRFYESNPVADYFLARWGVRGLVYFKFAVVAFVCLITQYIARTHIHIARGLLIVAIVIVSAVVIYSVYLYYTDKHQVHHDPGFQFVINTFF